MKKPLYDMNDVRRRFIRAMRKRTNDKEREGFEGWAEREWQRLLRRRVEARVKQGKWVDVANFAMFLWNLDGRKAK